MDEVPVRSRPTRSRRAGPLAAAVLLAAGVSLGACSSSSPSGTSGAGSSTTAAGSGTTVAGAGGSAVAVAKVSANDASAQEITAALTAAGVANAGRWTREIEEYRPYPIDDPSLSKLRTNLAKYNPSPETLQQIMSVLQP